MGVFGVAFAVPRAAHADLAHVRLAVVHTVGAESCLRDVDLRADVTARLGRDAFDAEALRSIEVVLARDPSAFTARIFTREDPASAPATRVLTSDPNDCARLRASVSLAVALAIDPDAPLTPPPPSPPPASAPPASSPPPSSSPPPRVAPRPPDPQAWDRSDRLAVRVGIAAGPLPAVGPVLAIGLETARAGFLRGSFGALRTLEVRNAPAPGDFGFTLTAFWGALCAGTASERFAAAACLGAQAGLVSGVVHNLGLVPVDPGDYGWLTVIVPLRAAVRIADPIVFELSAEPYLALLRQSFRLDTTTVVFEQPPVGIYLYGGVRVRFW